MGIVVEAKQVVVEVEGAKFFFDPVTFGDILGIPGIFSGTPPTKEVVDFLLNKLKKWEDITDTAGNVLPCSKENLLKLGAKIGLDIMRKFADKAGLTEEFEKNLEKLSTPSES